MKKHFGVCKTAGLEAVL